MVYIGQYKLKRSVKINQITKILLISSLSQVKKYVQERQLFTHLKQYFGRIWLLESRRFLTLVHSVIGGDFVLLRKRDSNVSRCAFNKLQAGNVVTQQPRTCSTAFGLATFYVICCLPVTIMRVSYACRDFPIFLNAEIKYRCRLKLIALADWTDF